MELGRLGTGLWGVGSIVDKQNKNNLKIGVLCGFHHISNSVKVHQLSGEHVSIASHTIFWPQTRLAFLKQNDR